MRLDQMIAIGAVGVLIAAMVVFLVMLRKAPAYRRWANLLLPASQLVFALFLLGMVVAYGLPGWALWLIAATCLACAGADVLLLKALAKAEQADMVAERARLLDEQVAAQAEQRACLEADVQAARQARGRLSAELDRVDALLAGDELSEVPAQLTHVMEVAEGRASRFCEHRVVDALIAAKSRAFAANNIRFEAHLEVPDSLPFPDVEMCALFSNALDNALHACAAVPEDERFIELRARVSGGFFLVDVRNACDSQASAPVLSRRHRAGFADHGWGLAIMQAVTHRHAGTFDVECAKGVFRTSVTLELLPSA